MLVTVACAFPCLQLRYPFLLVGRGTHVKFHSDVIGFNAVKTILLYVQKGESRFASIREEKSKGSRKVCDNLVIKTDKQKEN